MDGWLSGLGGIVYLNPTNNSLDCVIALLNKLHLPKSLLDCFNYIVELSIAIQSNSPDGNQIVEIF